MVFVNSLLNFFFYNLDFLFHPKSVNLLFHQIIWLSLKAQYKQEKVKREAFLTKIALPLFGVILTFICNFGNPIIEFLQGFTLG